MKLFRAIEGKETDNLWIATNTSRFAPSLSLKDDNWIDLDKIFVRIADAGTVTSVSQTVPTGFVITGSPITVSGTLAITNTFTSGSVVFAMGTGFAQDNANFFWDDANNKLGIGINSSLQAKLHIKGVGNDSTTNSLFIENVNGTDQFWTKDDGSTYIRTGIDQIFSFSGGNLSITNDTGIIRNTSVIGAVINWNYVKFTTSNITTSTNGLNPAIWDISFTTQNSGTDLGTTRFLRIIPTINQSNVADFIGFHYAPIVTSIGGRHYAAVYESGDMIVGGASANISARFQIDSTTKGFLPPRMTTAQRDSISSPTAGLLIYNTSTSKLNLYTTIWEQITSA